MTHGKALGITLAVVLVVAAFLGLCSVLGIREYWAGFLFLTQWGLMEQCKVERLPHSIGGAIVGTLIALTPSQLPVLLGTVPGTAVMFAIILWSIYALIMGWLPMIINAATMIFLTVVTIPEIVRGATSQGIFTGLAAGIACFGGLGLIAAALTKRAAPPKIDVPSA